MHIVHSDGYFVMSAYYDSVLDFRFGAFSLNILFKVPWSLLLKVKCVLECVNILRHYSSLSIWRDGNQSRSLKWYSITTCCKPIFLWIQ